MLEDKTKGWDFWAAVVITLLVILVGILCFLLSSSWEGYKQLCASYCRGSQAVVTIGIPMECRCIGSEKPKLIWDIPVIWRGG